MAKLRFTKEEQQQIKQSLNTVLDDIRELWKTTPLERIEMTVDEEMSYHDVYYLIITDELIYLTDIIHDDTYYLEEKKKIGRVKRSNDINLAFAFVKNYEEIRKKIEKKLRSNNEYKKQGLKTIEEVNRHYVREATIELDLPQTNNQHKIEVTEEDGRTVGKIDFGNRTIKIITDGDIVLVNRQAVKVKSK